MIVELFTYNDKNETTAWSATARWIKYEEETEGVDNFWGKPHVSYLYMKTLNQVKQVLARGLVLLDPPNVSTFEDIKETLLANISKRFDMSEQDARQVVDKLLCYKHGKVDRKFFTQMFSRRPSIAINDQAPSLNGAEMMPSSPVSKTAIRDNKEQQFASTAPNSPQSLSKMSIQNNVPYRLSIDEAYSTHMDGSDVVEAETHVARIFLIEQSNFEKLRLVMIRLSNDCFIPEIRHRSKIRFIFLLFGPHSVDLENHDVCRAIGVLLTNKLFEKTVFTAESREHMVRGVIEFMNNSLILSQVDIDNQNLLTLEDQREFILRRRHISRKYSMLSQMSNVFEIDKAARKISKNNEVEIRKKFSAKPAQVKIERDPFERTGTIFRGVLTDLKDRLFWYMDDWKAGLHVQIISSVFYIFFINLASAVAIGDTLGQKIDELMGVSEMLISHAVSGVVWSLFAGQPMCIMAAVGPFLVFEYSLFEICYAQSVDFLATRFWVGLWTFVFMILLAIFEAPFFMKYITRFTEDLFTGLIAFIFIWEAGKFLYKEFDAHPVNGLEWYCAAFYENRTVSTKVFKNSTIIKKITQPPALITINQPNTALLELVLFCFTFLLAFKLKMLRSSVYFSGNIRRFLSNFAVPIAFFGTALLDALLFKYTYTKHVDMRYSIGLTRPTDRNWLINPMGNMGNLMPHWMIAASIIPAFFATILFYAEVEIVENMLRNKSRCLKKPSGFHLDLIICGALAFVSSILGLPWMCPAAVQTIAHSESLTIMKKSAPGETPQIERVLEQRISTMLIALLHGAAAFLGIIMIYIPSSAMFGLFLYLGVFGLLNLEFWRRLVLLIVPKKYFPKEPFCLDVSVKKLHLFTLIQLVCFLVLFAVNVYPSAALAVPLILMLMAVFRHFVFRYIFGSDELAALDGTPSKKLEEINEKD